MEKINNQEVETYIEDLFKEKIPENLSYHNLEHTRYVVEQSILIGNESNLSAEDLEIVVTAAWFHDSGFAVSTEEHEKEGQKIASEFLLSKNVDDITLKRVLDCIQATKMPQDPGDDMAARVLCDADMSYLSKDFYLERTTLLRAEWNNISDTKMSKRVYWEETVELFRTHRYFTEYGKKMFSPGKEKNLQLILGKLSADPDKKNKKLKKLKSENRKLAGKLDKEKLPGRGVESMFRLTARNQINLSSIADNKANILISVNSIVLLWALERSPITLKSHYRPSCLPPPAWSQLFSQFYPHVQKYLPGNSPKMISTRRK